MSSNKTFEERIRGLNKEQKEAVEAIEGPIMVLAGPGTGKTTILTLRIANILLRTDTPPSGILALTFTDAGVKAMKAKLRELIGSRSDEVRIHTFHSFASSVISEFDDHFPELSRSSQITEVESETLIRQILEDKKFSKLRPLGDKDFYVGKILGSISDSKKEAWTPEMIRSFSKDEIERIKNDEDNISSRGATKGQLKADCLKRIERCEKTILFADVYELYEKKKKEERKIDFDDLIFELLLALKNDELLLQLLQEKFLYVLVDEHQDTNDSQNLIISYLLNFFETPNIFVVGDEKQAIYRFQGASVENFLRFQNLWKEMKVISLTNNYRSHQSILDASFGMIERNYSEGQYENLRTRLVSKSNSKQKPIDYILAGNNYSADSFLIDNIKEINKSDPDSNVAVIVRRNRDVEHFISLCKSNDIEASAERGVDIFSHPIGLIYFDLLQYFFDPSYVEGLASSLSVGLWGVEFGKSVEYIKKIRSGKIDEVVSEIPAISDLHKTITDSGVINYLILIADMSGLTKLVTESPESSEVWRKIISLAREISENSNISDSRTLIKNLLDYKKSSETKSIKIGSGNVSSKVVIMTAHSSKGLEYDYVFLPMANEESWMFKQKTPTFVLPREKGESDDIRDSRRLFYVALTRAKKHAVIIASEKNSLGKDLIPLRFIDELDQKHINKKNISAEEESLKAIPIDKLKNNKEKEITEYTKRVILEKGLSVTALNHFLECPSAFLYKSILKLPEPPSATSEKGIAMHKALSLVWKSSDKSVKSIQSIIEKTVKEYFTESLLRVFEKETILEELVQNAPDVSKELFGHFNSSGDVSTEKWVEKSFKTKFDNKEIDFTLHGQLDAVLVTAVKIEIFDYKTKEGMSVNAIKGQTESSDGNYFRQLVFYKMLLEEKTEKEILPSLVFVKPDSKGRCPIINLPIEKSDIESVSGEIENLINTLWSGEVLNKYCDDPECKWCAYKKML